MDNFIWFPISMLITVTVIASFGIYHDHSVKMRELDLIEKGIIKKEIIDTKGMIIQRNP